jgi:hypothetical protein
MSTSQLSESLNSAGYTPAAESRPRKADQAAILVSLVRRVQRTENERIRLGDCRNVIELMDEVHQGKLRATLAALEAGSFGGTSTVAQILFGSVGVIFICATVPVLMVLGAKRVFELGITWLATAGASAVARTYNLRRLDQHLRAIGDRGIAADQVAHTACPLLGKGLELQEMDGTGTNPGIASRTRALTIQERESKAAEMRNAKTTDRLTRAAHQSLFGLTLSAMLFFSWFVLFYFSVGGNVGMDPVMPNDPSAAFFACTTTGLAVTACSAMRFAWLVFCARTKEAQDWAVKFCATIGTVFGILTLLSSSSIGGGILGFLCFACFTVSGALHAYLRHVKKSAMTTALKADIAKYAEAWSRVQVNTAWDSIEGKLKLVQEHVGVRTKFELDERSTGEQLVIMLAQAWGLTGTFEQISDAWQEELHKTGHLSATHAPAEHEKGLLPKRRKRAIEKVWRSYNGVATRLCDLVRCSLVFDTPEGMEAGLDLILKDRSIRIVRAKNRFARDYDAPKQSCGYRDIQLNAVVEGDRFTDDEVALGLHEHACEIQLHLSAVYEHKNDEGHKRYVEYRNRCAD